jgi:hypothetical protein
VRAGFLGERRRRRTRRRRRRRRRRLWWWWWRSGRTLAYIDQPRKAVPEFPDASSKDCAE